MRLRFFNEPTFVWRQIHWPATVEPELGLALLRQIATDAFVRCVVLEVESDGGGLIYRIGVPTEAVPRSGALFAALLPDGALTPPVDRPALERSWKIALSAKHRPLVMNQAEQISRGLLAALASVEPREHLLVQWLLGPARTPRSASGATAATIESWWRPLLGGDRELDAEQRQALQAKRSDHAFACIGRVAVAGASQSRALGLAVSVLAGLRLAQAPGVGLRLVREDPERFARPALPWRWPYTLNVPELLGLLAWPLGAQALPGIDREAARWLRADRRIGNRRVLGAATAPGEYRLLGLSIDDARQHLHVIGPTGTGKSTLLANLILEDAAAGRSVVVIEPKGDLIADVLARMPESRRGDVVVLDPTDTGYPVGLNPLLSRGRRPELVADQVLAVFRGLWANNWGPRLQDILHASLLTLAGRGDASLCALPALLTNPVLRRKLSAEVDDPIALEPFWAWYEALSEPERLQAISPVLNKLRPFLLRRSVRAIVGQTEPRFRIDDVFTGRKIVLVSLAKGLVGPEAASLLGALFFAELWQAILGRGAIAPQRRHPVIVYADEFQDYVHLPTDMAEAAAQARGLGVGLVLAHQHLGQLPAALKASVLANIRSRVCFQLSADDAQTMARMSAGLLEPRDFQKLHRFEAYAQLVAGGELTSFASLRTRPLPPASSDAASIRRLSRERYGRPLAEVEADIARLVGADLSTDEPIGIRQRRQG
jgi:hypothetical protein